MASARVFPPIPCPSLKRWLKERLFSAEDLAVSKYSRNKQAFFSKNSMRGHVFRYIWALKTFMPIGPQTAYIHIPKYWSVHIYNTFVIIMLYCKMQLVAAPIIRLPWLTLKSYRAQFVSPSSTTIFRTLKMCWKNSPKNRDQRRKSCHRYLIT